MGIFSGQSTLWTRYRTQIQFRDKIMGGIPRDPKLIEAWLRTKAGLDEGELRISLIRTLTEMGVDVNPTMSLEDMERASEKVAGLKETTGFKRDEEHGLYIESRQIKAGMREAVNILHAGDKEWAKHVNNPTRKGAKSFFNEHVFVNPDKIYLGRTDPDGIDMVVGHVTGPQGPRSTLGYHEYVKEPLIEFHVMVARDLIPTEWWPDLWEFMQENAFGALRSQGHGRNDVMMWEEVDFTTPTNGLVSRELAGVN